MTRRAWMGGAAALASRPAVPFQSRKPNILFLMADQHRGDCMGNAGNRAVHTPNLDRLAGEGVRFRCAYSSTPTCTPARAALLTGLSPWHHGMLGYAEVAEHYANEMPRLLREAGYYTTGIGKMHWRPQRTLHGFHRTLLDESGRIETPDFRSDYRAWFWSQAPGMDPDATGIGWNDYDAKPYALPEELHPTRWTANTAVHFLEQYKRPEPFFLKVSFARPHSPYDAPERFWQRYREADLPRANVGAWAKRYAPRSSDATDIWHGDLGPAQVRKSRQGYYGSVTFVDEQIGRILGALEKRGWLNETLILYTADHGDMTGDQNLWRKSYAYEASAHIPMLLRFPDAGRGRVVASPVEIRDILPTFLDAAGASRPEMDGHSLLRRDAAREWIDLEHDICYAPENHWNALTDGRSKYIFHARDGEEQLFDLEKDPCELRDLAGEPGFEAQLRMWRARMIGHLSERGERFVRNGRLALRPEGMRYSPNYPSSNRAAARPK